MGDKSVCEGNTVINPGGDASVTAPRPDGDVDAKEFWARITPAAVVRLMANAPRVAEGWERETHPARSERVECRLGSYTEIARVECCVEVDGGDHMPRIYWTIVFAFDPDVSDSMASNEYDTREDAEKAADDELRDMGWVLG